MARKPKAKRRGRRPLPPGERREKRSVRLPGALWADVEAHGEITSIIEHAVKAYMYKVITYQSPAGREIHLTPAQIDALERAGKWPKDHAGQEYCTVSHGLHDGEPSMTDEQLESL